MVCLFFSSLTASNNIHYLLLYLSADRNACQFEFTTHKETQFKCANLSQKVLFDMVGKRQI